jgi:hypothetical protein
MSHLTLAETTLKRVMTSHNQRLPCGLGDIKPTIATIESMRIHQRRESFVTEKMEEARAMRAAYQYELLRCLASTVVSFFHRPNAAKAPVIARRMFRGLRHPRISNNAE